MFEEGTAGAGSCRGVHGVTRPEPIRAGPSQILQGAECSNKGFRLYSVQTVPKDVIYVLGSKTPREPIKFEKLWVQQR